MSAPIRIAFAPTRMGGNPYLDDLAASLPADRIVEVKGTWDELAGPVPTASVDVVHIHLIQMLLDESASPRRAAARFVRRLVRMRRRGIGIVWTMHNVSSHETSVPYLDRLVRRATAAACRRVIVHCAAAERELRRLWPAARAQRIPHPARARSSVTREEARRALDISETARAVAIPGRIRGYKDVPGALSAILAQADNDTVVLVAGAPHDERLADQVRAAAGSDPRARLYLQLLDDDEIARIVAASDVVVLPYRKILTSGTAVLASELGVPSVAPALGCLPEQLGDGGLFHEQGDLATAARLALRTPLDELRRRGARAQALALVATWDKAGLAHARVYEEAFSR